MPHGIYVLEFAAVQVDIGGTIGQVPALLVLVVEALTVNGAIAEDADADKIVRPVVYSVVTVVKVSSGGVQYGMGTNGIKMTSDEQWPIREWLIPIPCRTPFSHSNRLSDRGAGLGSTPSSRRPNAAISSARGSEASTSPSSGAKMTLSGVENGSIKRGNAMRKSVKAAK